MGNAPSSETISDRPEDLFTYLRVGFASRQSYIPRDLYNRILLSLSPMKYRSESDSTSSDDERDSKRWELKRVVDHKNKQGTVWYLVRWKGYGLKEAYRRRS